MENQVKNGVEIEVANGVGKWSGDMDWRMEWRMH